MLTRKIPYIELSKAQIIGAVGYGDKQVPIPTEGNPLVIEIMKKCLNKDRKKRPTFLYIGDKLTEVNNQLAKKRIESLSTSTNIGIETVVNQLKMFFGE